MNKSTKFQNFLESLKGQGHGQDSLIESVKKGFKVCFEETMSPFQSQETSDKQIIKEKSENNNLIPIHKVNLGSPIASNDGYKIYKLTNVEDVMAISYDTFWSTQEKGPADMYLKGGPFYYVTKDNKKFALGHEKVRHDYTIGFFTTDAIKVDSKIEKKLNEMIEPIYDFDRIEREFQLRRQQQWQR